MVLFLLIQFLNKGKLIIRWFNLYLVISLICFVIGDRVSEYFLLMHLFLIMFSVIYAIFYNFFKFIKILFFS